MISHTWKSDVILAIYKLPRFSVEFKREFYSFMYKYISLIDQLHQIQLEHPSPEIREWARQKNMELIKPYNKLMNYIINPNSVDI